MEKYKILIIDDDNELRYSLERVLKRDKESLVHSATNGLEGVNLYKENHYDIVITDLIMEKLNGLEVIKSIKEIDKDSLIILITGKGTSELAAEAISLGAYDYFSKPFDYTEFFKTIRNAKEKVDLRKEKIRYQNIIENENRFFNLYYKSDAMKKIVEDINRFVRFDGNILILGESGTGKELIAESIYLSSKRRDNNFVKINCSALPDNLVESELFGHEKGAFTGAGNSRKGKLEMADNGMVFLDEIGDLNLNSQAKLLRVLEDGSLEKVGSSIEKKIDISVVAATNINLEEKIKEKKFRLDLFYRLNTFVIKVPPLRERKDDIIFLASKFINDFCKKFDIKEKKINNEIKKTLLRYSWPGNVRELKSVIQNLIIHSEDFDDLSNEILNKFISIKDSIINHNDFETLNLKEFLKEQEKKYLENLIRNFTGNKSAMAKKVGLSRTALYDKLNEHDISFN